MNIPFAQHHGKKARVTRELGVYSSLVLCNGSVQYTVLSILPRIHIAFCERPCRSLDYRWPGRSGPPRRKRHSGASMICVHRMTCHVSDMVSKKPSLIISNCPGLHSLLLGCQHLDIYALRADRHLTFGLVELSLL